MLHCFPRGQLEPLIRGWGGLWWGEPLALGRVGTTSLEPAPRARPSLGLSGRSLLWTWWQVPSCWQGDKEVSCRVTAPLGPSIGPGNNPGGDEVNKALSAPRAGTGMEMGCSSPTSLQAACGAHGHDWCDAGCHPGEVTHVVSSVAPCSPLPITIPTAGGRRGLAVEPHLVCPNSSITACVQMRWGHPRYQGAERGFPGRESAGKGSAVLTQQLFLLSQQEQPRAGPMCWGGHPHPPGPGHSSGGTELVGTSPTTPKLAPP